MNNMVFKKMCDSNNNRFVKVVLPIPIKEPLIYSVPDTLIDTIKIGMCAVVPLGNRITYGYVIGFTAPPESIDTKPIINLIDSTPVISDELLKLTKWVSEYYFCCWGEVIKSALPPGIGYQSRKIVRLKEPYSLPVLEKYYKKSAALGIIIETLRKNKQISLQTLRKKVGNSVFYSLLHKLEKSGYIEILDSTNRRIAKPKLQKVVWLINPELRSSSEKPVNSHTEFKKQQCINLLQKKNGKIELHELKAITKISDSVLRKLVYEQVIKITTEEVFRDPLAKLSVSKPPVHVLTYEQREVLLRITSSLKQGKFETILLHGITDSGKTEIYIRAVYETINQKKQAIILVPEIALTPQMIDRFKSHFHHRVTVLHSRLSVGERYDIWRKIKQSQFDVVIGARLSVFAPVTKLGVIIVDEEHEPAYKQSDSPRYHARDVAIMRAKINNAIVILGSATPSFESYYRALTGKYTLLRLTERINKRKLPTVKIIDLRTTKNDSVNKTNGTQKTTMKMHIFTDSLKQKIQQRINRREQIILFLNRRGFSTFVQCQDCGMVIRCPGCNITLTYHADKLIMKCHYCDYQTPAPKVCSVCQGYRLNYRGIGTQRVEKEIALLFPDAKISRMDIDTTQLKEQHRRILDDFGTKKIDILLGTQMVAKGLDFSSVTLVGVIYADTALHLPDFRASERTFQLLTQVAGRTGRGPLGGEVIIQTYSPDHPSIKLVQHHDYNGFFSHEIKLREELDYPPFTRLALLLVKGANEEEVETYAQNLKTTLEELCEQKPQFDSSVKILGPAPAPIPKIRGIYRWQILIKCKNANRLISLISALIDKSYTIGDNSLEIDVDPVSIL